MHARMLLVAPIAALALPAAGGTLIDTRVHPSTAQAPSDVVVQAYVERDARNRWLEFVIDSDTFFSSSTAELDGARAPRRKDVRFRRLPAGAYEIRVTVIGTDGRRATSVRHIALW